jgi:chromosome segregation protein
MLTRIELVGFKSFADKTRLDFEPGVSAIVGPNGSGKSNVVDAIRWILGEQSPKSLRGKEMADVIFNGSATRRPHGMAEVSLHLDNTRRYLPVDLDEVVLSRRIFRSGESEYYINGRAARLRDVRDLFLDTGAGRHAYSIIEQGKVDQILQASAKDRRYIFEEAAGVSRFKARKIEALRRLERVQQNLVRVRDIHEEVDRQLRGLRSQAGKARRYRELADRLKTLRLYAGALEHRRCSEEIDAIEALLAPTHRRLEADRARLAEDEPKLAELDQSAAAGEEALRRFAARMSSVRESILAAESHIAKDQARAAELDEETLVDRLQLARARRRLRDSADALAAAAHRHAEANEERRRIDEEVASAQREADRIAEAVQRALRERDGLEAEAEALYQRLSRLENEQAALESQLSVLWQNRERTADRVADLVARLDAERRAAGALALQESSVRGQLGAFADQADAVGSDHRRLLERRAALREEIAERRRRRIALASRIDVLEQLRARREGLDAGVRKVMDERGAGREEWSAVLGVLAEQIDAPAHLADVVELALGPRAQALVVARLADISDALLEHARRLPGRVQFLAIEDPQPDRLVVVDDAIPWPAVAALVQCEPAMRPLIDRLLGQTYLADDFQRARRAVRESVDLRFVTPDGDVLEPDGSVAAGPSSKTTGILARSAEIRALREDLERLDQSIAEIERKASEADARIQRLEEELSQREVRRATLAEQAQHFEHLVRRSRERADELEQRVLANRAEWERVLAEIHETDGQFLAVDRALAEAHESIAAVNDRVGEVKVRLEEHSAEQARLLSELAQRRTALAVVEERLASLRDHERQLSAQTNEHRVHVEDRERRLRSAQDRRTEIARRLLAARADLADLYAQKDRIALEPGVDPDALDALRDRRRRLSDELAAVRRRIAEDQETAHQGELRRTELRLTRESLAGRIAEDYGVDLASYVAPEDQRIDLSEEEAAREIEDLRQKLARLGAVNADAADELDDLEGRAATFQHQINDLVVAQRHLDQLIARINEECRRLFLDAFESIRGHFQELFRKLFGGGKADILLEDETDVLETGIEIVARPPGKEPQSISLLSGGEKTLAAVALIMAVFRSKPSPFCILDEVDAALDEANIGRFVQILREFTTISQFILITHSKTTMASADVLHGVTQRESGVSIRVSVRLEDVAEDGRFLDSPTLGDHASHEPAA